MASLVDVRPLTRSTADILPAVVRYPLSLSHRLTAIINIIRVFPRITLKAL